MIKNTINFNLVIEHRSHISHKMVSQFSALLTTSSVSSTAGMTLTFRGNLWKARTGLIGEGRGRGRGEVRDDHREVGPKA